MSEAHYGSVKGKKIPGNSVPFPRAQPQPFEKEIYLLNQKFAFRLAEKYVLSQRYVKSDSFGVFRKLQRAKESEMTYTSFNIK